jgi:hypothetical protein
MQLIKQKGPFCLATSCAMILDLTTEKVHDYIGHDGTEIWWPPTGMRGVHIQEIKEICYFYNTLLYQVDRRPMSAPDEHTVPKPVYTEEFAEAIFKDSISARRAILITPGHAVAWDGGQVYDPKGFIKSYEDYPSITEAYIAFVI